MTQVLLVTKQEYEEIRAETDIVRKATKISHKLEEDNMSAKENPVAASS